MPKVMERNLSLCRESVLLLEDFVNRNKTRVRWVKPQGSGMAFIRMLNSDGEPVDDAEFCMKLKEEEGICLVPGGHCFGEGDAGDFKGYVRITLGNPTLLREVLPLLGNFTQKQRVVRTGDKPVSDGLPLETLCLSSNMTHPS